MRLTPAVTSVVSVLAILLGGCSLLGGPTAKRTRHVEEELAAAGFRQIPADTPDKLTRLQAMKPRRQLTISERAGKTYYWYADPEGCRCFYVGGQAAYDRFERLRVQDEVVESERATARMEETAAETDQQMEGYFAPYGAGAWYEFPGWVEP